MDRSERSFAVVTMIGRTAARSRPMELLGLAQLDTGARALAARSFTFSAGVYLIGSSSEVSLRRCSKSAIPPVSVFSSFHDPVSSSPSVCDARGHKISPLQTRARPAAISEIPSAHVVHDAVGLVHVKGRGVPRGRVCVGVGYLDGGPRAER
jgi:hypothetical protein